MLTTTKRNSPAFIATACFVGATLSLILFIVSLVVFVVIYTQKPCNPEKGYFCEDLIDATVYNVSAIACKDKTCCYYPRYTLSYKSNDNYCHADIKKNYGSPEEIYDKYNDEIGKKIEALIEGDDKCTLDIDDEVSTWRAYIAFAVLMNFFFFIGVVLIVCGYIYAKEIPKKEQMGNIY
jgi:hypothetical protein